MGYIKHHAIVVCGWDDIAIAHEKAIEIFGELVSNVVPGVINGYQSFFIAPDGSKEGWEVSTTHDDKRDEYIEWIKVQEATDHYYSYAELFFGEDNGYSQVERHN
jgi:hypothetical protein